MDIFNELVERVRERGLEEEVLEFEPPEPTADGKSKPGDWSREQDEDIDEFACIPELAFLAFLGKQMEADENFGPEVAAQLVTTREPPRVHGAVPLESETFLTRLRRLRREVPEAVDAVGSLRKSTEEMRLCAASEAQGVVSLNKALAEDQRNVKVAMSKFVMSHSEFQRATYGPDVTHSVLFDPWKSEGVIPRRLLAQSLRGEAGDKEPAVTFQRLEETQAASWAFLAGKEQELWDRIKRIQEHLKIPTDFDLEGKTLPEVLSTLYERVECLLNESYLEGTEGRFRLAISSLDLLEGKELPPEPPELKDIQLPDDWIPSKQVAKLHEDLREAEATANKLPELISSMKRSRREDTLREYEEFLGDLGSTEAQFQHLQSIIKRNSVAVKKAATMQKSGRSKMQELLEALKLTVDTEAAQPESAHDA